MRNTGRVFQPERARLAADGGLDRTIALAADELIEVAGRSMIESVVQLSTGPTNTPPAAHGPTQAWPVNWTAMLERTQSHSARISAARKGRW
jgi:hypothetical protein